MSYDDQVLALFGEANPVSDRDTLEHLLRPHLEVVEQRIGDMKETKVRVIDPAQPIVKQEQRHRLAYGLVAAVAVLIVGTVTWIAVVNDGEPDVASPVDIGRSFIEAQDAWDADAATALLAPDAVIKGSGLVTEVEQYASNFAWYQALDWRWAVEECNQTTVGPPAEVRCTLTHQNAWTRALGVGPYSGSSIDFVIGNGQIQELTDDTDLSAFSPEAWGVFTKWVTANHPSELGVMIRRQGLTSIPIVTPEALALWEQYTNEFVASVTP